MEMSIANLREESRVLATARSTEAPASAVAWGAILGGAVTAAALSLILLALGSGLGLSAISPWTYDGASATSLRFGSILWLILMSALASGLGGYIAGRLRTKWSDIDADEAFFRDTAHGLLAWAVATIVSAAVLTSTAMSMAGTVATTGAAAAAGVGATAANTAAVAEAKTGDASNSYFVDMLFRGDRASEAGPDATILRSEAAGILANAQRQGEISAGDKAYLAQLVARHTGANQADAEQRVAQTTEAAKLAADAAAAKARALAETVREAMARLALWIFVSLLIGAFCAAFAATLGGRLRDRPSHLREAI